MTGNLIAKKTERISTNLIWTFKDGGIYWVSSTYDEIQSLSEFEKKF